jgi:hypothetical protein
VGGSIHVWVERGKDGELGRSCKEGMSEGVRRGYEMLMEGGRREASFSAGVVDVLYGIALGHDQIPLGGDDETSVRPFGGASHALDHCAAILLLR